MKGLRVVAWACAALSTPVIWASPGAQAQEKPDATLPAQRPYSAREKTRMMLCVGLTDNAFSIADAKLAGRAAADLKTEYASRPEARLTVPLVDKVYADSFSHSWDYAVAFFKECALNLAEVPDTRAGLAAYCMQNSMIASIAYNSRNAGAPREQTYKLFAQFPSEASRKIIDQVYEQSKSRPEEMVDTWTACMAPLTGD
jgi:hypothetical protein